MAAHHSAKGTKQIQTLDAIRPCSNIFRNVQSRNGALISLSGGLLIYHFINSLNTKDKKRVAFDRAKKITTEKYKIFTHDSEGGIEYYYLDLSSDKTDAVYRLEIRTGIKNREKAEAEKSAKTNEASTAGEGDTTQNLF